MIIRKTALLCVLMLVTGVGSATPADLMTSTPPAMSSTSPSPPLQHTSNKASNDDLIETADAGPDLSARRSNLPFDEHTQAMLAQGARLSSLGDCMVCHTAKGGQPYAGGRPLKTPFGTIYTTNITPDTRTGIGKWSEADFVRAMRRGESRDGHLLYPAFPYVHFTHITDPDLQALYQFLMSRDPVDATAPDNKLIFPLNFRPLVAAWNVLFLRNVGVVPDAQASTNVAATNSELQRGKYLVDSLGHCAACHTPMNFLGAEKSGQAFAGGMVDGWTAPALVDLADRPKPWTREQLALYLRTGVASEHGAAAGPMLAVTQHLAQVPKEDVEAIATYIMSMQNAASSSTNTTSSAGSSGSRGASGTTDNKDLNAQMAESVRSGAVIFNASCASCHGAAAPMHTQADRPLLSASTSVNAADPRNTVQQILQGIAFEGTGTTLYMPAFSTMLTDAQIADVANYTRFTFSKNAPWTSLDADTVAKLRKQGVSQ